MVIPIRAHLESVRRLLQGDVYIGRGSRQRALPWSRYCNNFEVSEHGRDAAIAGFRDMLLQDGALYASSWTLSGTRPVCHCPANERCHGDLLVEEFRRTYPAAYDRADCLGALPEAQGPVARLREEPESDEGWSPDEGVPGKFAEHRGIGKPMRVGVGYVQRDLCDGQSLASPGRWHPASRVYLSTDHWYRISDVFQRFHGSLRLRSVLGLVGGGESGQVPVSSR